MKVLYSLATATAAGLASFFPSGATRSANEQTFRFMSYNFRYDSKPDNVTVQQTIDSLPQGLPATPTVFYPNTDELPWSTRRIGITNEILFPRTDILGVQEVLKRQVDDLQILLGNGWAYIGVGRDDGQEAGEWEAIFFKKEVFKLLAWDTFWLSDIPFEPSKYLGAGSFRSCTAARFQSAAGSFTLLNTHFDDQSDGQRRLAASLVLHRAKYETIKTKRPVFVTGDFNSPASGIDSGAYEIVTGVKPPLTINATFAQKYSWTKKEESEIGNFTLIDVLVATPPERRSGNFATFTGFQSVNDSNMFTRIDFVFGASNGGWAAQTYHRGNSLYDDGIHHSDHRPIYTDLTIMKSVKKR